MEITHLDEAVDVYSEWIDRCREANVNDAGSKGQSNSGIDLESSTDKGEYVDRQKAVRKMKLNEESEQIGETFKNDSFGTNVNVNEEDYEEKEEEMPSRKRLTKNAVSSGLFDDD